MLLADVMNTVAPLILGCAAMLCVLVAVLTRHQRNMAEILNRNAPPDALAEQLHLLRAEMSRLEAKVDALSQSPLPRTETQSLQDPETRRLTL